MNEEQWQAMYGYFANWLNMASVALLAVGLFEAEHMFGGLIGATACGLFGLIAKIWSKK